MSDSINSNSKSNEFTNYYNLSPNRKLKFTNPNIVS